MKDTKRTNRRTASPKPNTSSPVKKRTGRSTRAMTDGGSGGDISPAETTVVRMSDLDVHLFREGNHFRLYEKLGAHLRDGACDFGVWAPNAESVSVVGGFNGWDPQANPLDPRWDESGIWEGTIEDATAGSLYKYHIVSRHGGYTVDKGDPYGFAWEIAPRTASIVWDLEYEWNDRQWMEERDRHNRLDAPFSIYEVHPGSWRRVPEEDNRPLTYRELAPRLTEHVLEMGFTHVELLPVMEHPFYGSWGYQIVGYYAPTSRYGTPQDFMYLIDYLHQHGIGVIMDWVPSHFPSNENGLVFFDGTYLYEHADPRRGFHPDWKSYIFNYDRNEVRNFLISNALFWLDKYHIDGLRVDAVASMLYLDYSREPGEWVPNQYGGNEDIGAIRFLRRFNEMTYQEYPSVQTIAEESTAWPMVSRPVYTGGLGFGMKWNMGWMHDTLEYFSENPVHRKYYHDHLTFSLLYAFNENFVLPLSHDEVVHGKGSLLGKMPGDDWQKFANLRLLLGFMWLHPGKKLLFMGAELGQWSEWNHDTSLEWHLLDYPPHQGLKRWVSDLNRFYRSQPSLYERDFSSEGFRWIDCNDVDESVVSFIRRGTDPDDATVALCNFTPVPRHNYRLGVPARGYWEEVLNSDAPLYGGSGQGNLGGCATVPVASHGMYHSIVATAPPLGVTVFRHRTDTP